MFDFFKDKFTIAKSNENLAVAEEVVYLRELIKDLVREKFSSSLRLYIIDSASCNGCELELQLLFSPLYDLAAYGVEVTYEASEADILVVTGLMSENMHAELNEVYAKIKAPKQVVLVGDCPVFSVPFHDTFALNSKSRELFSKTFHVGGCPPEPLELLQALHNILKKI